MQGIAKARQGLASAPWVARNAVRPCTVMDSTGVPMSRRREQVISSRSQTRTVPSSDDVTATPGSLAWAQMLVTSSVWPASTCVGRIVAL